MNAIKQKKNFQISKKKIDALTNHRIPIYRWPFLITLTQFEKTGSINKTFISLEILNIKLETRSHDLLLFVGGVCIPFNRRNELNFKNQNANRETSILSMNKLKDFSWKKNDQDKSL